jgi:hypothetical protein
MGDVLKLAGIKAPPLFSSRLSNLLTDAVFDLTPIRKISGETPYTLDHGVAITVDWMRRHVLQRHPDPQLNSPSAPKKHID